jgi:hypothetical protein
VRNVQLYLTPEAEHLLEWFHITMRLTVMNQMAKGLPEKIGKGEDQYELRPDVLKDLDSLKWYLWHGNVFQAVKQLEGLEMDVEGAAFETKNETARKLLKQMEDLHTYVAAIRRSYRIMARVIAMANGSLRFRGVGRQSGREQTNGQAPADAVDATQRPSVFVN